MKKNLLTIYRHEFLIKKFYLFLHSKTNVRRVKIIPLT